MLEVISFDARDPLSVVDNFSPGLDQRVKYDVTKEVDNAYSSKSVSFLRQDSFAVKRKNLCLFATFGSLVEHVVENDCFGFIDCFNFKRFHHVLFLEGCHWMRNVLSLVMLATRLPSSFLLGWMVKSCLMSQLTFGFFRAFLSHFCYIIGGDVQKLLS